MMNVGLLFPGQGAQFVGMGRDLFDARPDLLGDSSDEILGWSLQQLCLEGPDEALTATDRAQPALYALSFALWQELERAGVSRPLAAAGHSLGEYTALAAAGVYSFAQGLRLVAERGAAMDHAASAEASGMTALIGAEPETAEALAQTRRAQGGKLWVANVNAPGQVVVAGGTEDMAWVADHVKEYGVRRAIPLKVAGAFHTPFMAGAQPRLISALSEIEFSEPEFPVWSNVTAQPFGPGTFAELLGDQITAPVQFASSLESMASHGVDVFVHVGPGDVTAGMAKRTVPDVAILTVNSLEGIGEVVETVQSAGTMTSSEEG